jgi:hypothetical protein
VRLGVCDSSRSDHLLQGADQPRVSAAVVMSPSILALYDMFETSDNTTSSDSNACISTWTVPSPILQTTNTPVSGWALNDHRVMKALRRQLCHRGSGIRFVGKPKRQAPTVSFASSCPTPHFVFGQSADLD